MAYSIEDFLKDGLSGGELPENIDEKELAMGIEVELEHTSNRDIAQKIAVDHLIEIPDYYSRLKKMEEEAKQVQKTAASDSGELPQLPYSLSEVRSQMVRPQLVSILRNTEGRRVMTRDGIVVGIGAGNNYESAYQNALSILDSHGSVSEIDAFFGPGQIYIVVLAGV